MSVNHADEFDNTACALSARPRRGRVRGGGAGPLPFSTKKKARSTENGAGKDSEGAPPRRNKRGRTTNKATSRNNEDARRRRNADNDPTSRKPTQAATRDERSPNDGTRRRGSRTPPTTSRPKTPQQTSRRRPRRATNRDATPRAPAGTRRTSRNARKTEEEPNQNQNKHPQKRMTPATGHGVRPRRAASVKGVSRVAVP